jgi:hypothetical protein
MVAAIASCADGKGDALVKDLIVEEGRIAALSAHPLYMANDYLFVRPGGDLGIYGVKFFINGR